MWRGEGSKKGKGGNILKGHVKMEACRGGGGGGGC